jgi:hypothetical protein
MKKTHKKCDIFRFAKVIGNTEVIMNFKNMSVKSMRSSSCPDIQALLQEKNLYMVSPDLKIKRVTMV